MKRKILIITGSRGEYGYIRPLMKIMNHDPDISFEVLITNMHLLSEFGNSEEEFKRDNLPIHHKIYNTFDGYNTVTMTKSLGVFLMQLPELLERSKPDIILIAGDRGEQLMAAIAGAHMNIPVAHIQAGEVSGNIDGQVRHAITKISHIHFASNQDAYQRVISLGEEEFRVFNLGAPLVDELSDPNFTNKEIKSKYNLSKEKRLFLIVQHPVTEEFEKSQEQMEETLKAVNEFDNSEIVIFLPNSDAGSNGIKNAISKHKQSNYHVFRNVERSDYSSLMKYCDLMIGNSSSGLMEAPTFNTPAINIGRRQSGRLQGKNVINTEYNKDVIIDSIKKALSTEFKESLKNITNPYGDGNSSKRILEILKNIKIDDKLINKRITY